MLFVEFCFLNVFVLFYWEKKNLPTLYSNHAPPCLYTTQLQAFPFQTKQAETKKGKKK